LVAGAPLAPGLEVLDGDTVRAPQHLVHGLEARSAAGEVHVVVEIPAGTTAKFEVDKTSGHLVWDRADGRRRRIAFLPYPASYGMIPRTLVDESAGGDGDPVDVVVLGGAVARGAVVAARPIGVLRMRDEGERDDKIIAVLARDDSAFRDLDSLSALETRFPAVLRILELWFASYEGPGVVTVEGFEDRVAAERAIAEAIKAYEAARSRDP
jgi:inorganic pyrophosphatase